MEEYKKLNEYFSYVSDFINNNTQDFEQLLFRDGALYFDDDENEEKCLMLFEVLMKVIYFHYRRDCVAYLNKVDFVDRLLNDLAFNFGKYIVKYNVTNILSNFSNETRYDDTSKMQSDTNERGLSSSSVVQSSASTPTGISSAQSSSINLRYQKGEDESGTEFVTDAYTDKYTNFQGKTNGLHDNDVERKSVITRKGKLLDIIELEQKLPNSLYDEVLKDVSKHFIFLY